jgi:hypothetical protein
MAKQAKPRSDSILEAIQPVQFATLERWLFVENASYQVARDRFFQEFGIKASTTTLSKWYQRQAQARLGVSALNNALSCLRNFEAIRQVVENPTLDSQEKVFQIRSILLDRMAKDHETKG